MFRQEGANFFEKDVVHAKGTFEGDPKSDTYKKFARAGCPVHRRRLGTMQGLVMAWELEKPLKDVPKDKQNEVRAEREKLIGIYMATLLAGGHHSASELLFSAQSYGYFDKVTDPLTNYPKAMKELGGRFTELGLPGGMYPKAGTIWLAARTEVSGNLLKLASEITATYKNEAYANAVDGQYKTEIQDKTEALFGDDLARKLDDIVAEVDDKVKRKKLTDEAGTMIETYRKTLTDEDLIRALDKTPSSRCRSARPFQVAGSGGLAGALRRDASNALWHNGPIRRGPQPNERGRACRNHRRTRMTTTSQPISMIRTRRTKTSAGGFGKKPKTALCAARILLGQLAMARSDLYTAEEQGDQAKIAELRQTIADLTTERNGL